MSTSELNSTIKQRHFDDKPNDKPRVWWRDNPVMTAFFNALSVLLPLGESFFIRSMKPFMGEIVDPKLEADVQMFISQESEHGREHARYNRMVSAQGYDLTRIGKTFSTILRAGIRHQPPMGLLANTVASEHVTAILSELVMNDERWLEGASTEHRRIWIWHAAEEIEHKAVAFDLYQSVGGGYGMRALAMVQTGIVFPVIIGEMMLRFLHHDGLLFKLSTWRQLAQFGGLILTSSGTILGRYAAFMHPHFHPNDHDDQATLDAWNGSLDTFCV